MPLTKLCARCGKVIPYGHARCPDRESKRADNSKQYDRFVRDKRSAAFYRSAQWIDLRAFCMVRDGYQCQRCKQQGIVKAAEEVHHTVPVRTDWYKRIDARNYVSQCHACHMQVEE